MIIIYFCINIFYNIKGRDFMLDFRILTFLTVSKLCILLGPQNYYT